MMLLWVEHRQCLTRTLLKRVSGLDAAMPKTLNTGKGGKKKSLALLKQDTLNTCAPERICWTEIELA